MKKQWLGLILIPAVFFGCSGKVEQAPPVTPKNPLQELLNITITPPPKDAAPTPPRTPEFDTEKLNEVIKKKGEISSMEIEFFAKYLPQCVQFINEYNKKNKDDAVAVNESLNGADWSSNLKGFTKFMGSYIVPGMTSADIPEAPDSIKKAADDVALRAKLAQSDKDSYNKLLEMEKKHLENRTKKWADLQLFLIQNGVDAYTLYRISEKICDIQSKIPPETPAEPPVDPETIPEIIAARQKIKELEKEKGNAELALKATNLTAEGTVIIKKALSGMKDKIAEQEKIIEKNMPTPKTPNALVNNPLKEYEPALKKALDEAVRP